LARAARQSARDEIRHAAQMTSLARRYGASPVAPRVAAPQRRRPALEIAQENAVEGCVRETFGALLAWQQATSAQDPVFARVLRGIAADETRHAALAWEVAAFIEPKLSARERCGPGAAAPRDRSRSDPGRCTRAHRLAQPRAAAGAAKPAVQRTALQLTSAIAC
jgi:hypothetical protein